MSSDEIGDISHEGKEMICKKFQRAVGMVGGLVMFCKNVEREGDIWGYEHLPQNDGFRIVSDIEGVGKMEIHDDGRVRVTDYSPQEPLRKVPIAVEWIVGDDGFTVKYNRIENPDADVDDLKIVCCEERFSRGERTTMTLAQFDLFNRMSSGLHRKIAEMAPYVVSGASKTIESEF